MVLNNGYLIYCETVSYLNAKLQAAPEQTLKKKVSVPNSATKILLI